MRGESGGMRESGRGLRAAAGAIRGRTDHIVDVNDMIHQETTMYEVHEMGGGLVAVASRLEDACIYAARIGGYIVTPDNLRRAPVEVAV